MAAKWMRHRSDNSNLANAIVEAVPARGFTALMRNFDQRTISRHAIENFIERHNHFRRPHPVFFEGHEFDETHNHAFFAGELAKRDRKSTRLNSSHLVISYAV